MPEKRGLGRGFDALIPTNVIETEFDVTAKPGGQSAGERVLEVSVDQVEPNPHQPRQDFNPERLAELTESIKRHGVIQPLVTMEHNGRYQLIAGERRWRASKSAGLKTVPVIVRTASQQQSMEMALVENLQRADLNAIETATAYRKLMDQFNLSPADIGRQVGRDESTITNTLRLLSLPIEVKRAIADGRISEGHARAILLVGETEKQLAVLAAVLEKGLTVRQTEDFARGLKGTGGSVEKAQQRASDTSELTRSLSDYLGAKVTQRAMAKGGRLIIEYYSDEELDRIYRAIKGD